MPNPPQTTHEDCQTSSTHSKSQLFNAAPKNPNAQKCSMKEV
jgi:hypothetical protein